MDKNQLQSDQDEYLKKKHDFIPLSPKLIEHVRRIDGFNEEELIQLKIMMTQVARKMQNGFELNKDTIEQDTEFRRFLEVTLKIHQVFALVDVNYDDIFSSVSISTRQESILSHLHQIIDQMVDKDGLNYVPRERSTLGRVFEHAADSHVLIHHLAHLNDPFTPIPPEQGEITYFLKLENDPVTKDGKMTAEAEAASLEEKRLEEKYKQKIFEELSIKQEHIVMTINRPYIDLTMKANGKADLYFHAHFWEKYLRNLTELQKRSIGGTSPRGRKRADGDEEGSVTPDTFVDIFKDNYGFVKRLIGLSGTLTKVIINIKKFPFHEKMYNKYVKEFGQRQLHKKMKYFEEIQRALFVAQIADDREGLGWIEKLLVQLLGYCDIQIRDQSIVLLNMLYDSVDWQLQEAFRPVVRCVGQHFIIKVIVQKPKKTADKDYQIFLGLVGPSPIQGNNHNLLTWHKIEERNIIREDKVELEIEINFGKFWKCGFYDWRLISISEEGKLQPFEIIGKPDPVFPATYSAYDDYYEESIEEEIGNTAQGRFIVHARGMREHNFHEVQIDYQNAKIDKKENTFISRGTFADVERSIEGYARQGITALYLMGTLERDNDPFHNNYSNDIQFRKEDASALATIDRSRANTMLGGSQGLKKVVQEAKENKVKIIVDSLARISSSRHHRKYKNLLLHYLDEEGRRHICYGTDGQAQKFEDTAMLNYRKIEAWELLIDEIIEFADTHEVDGIHLDNGQAWPQILEPDIEELTRKDPDGEFAYSHEDFMNGEVVIRNENFGYWNSNNMETYPNPFFIKLCMKLWLTNPNFMILGECWGGFMLENRQIILSRSGVVPRLYRLPMAISTLFGKKLHRDGRVEDAKKQSVETIQNWYTESHRFLPEGSIVLQSSTAHSLPYPAYLYGKGTWAAIDILFFLPDIPITFMGEIDGDIYKVGQTTVTVFQQEQMASAPQTGELKRSNSQIMRALQGGDMESEKTRTSASTASIKTIEERRGLPRVHSGTKLSAVYVEAKDGQVPIKEQQFKQNLTPEKGFDLSKINTHYQSRRRLRKEKMVLKYGELIMLQARSLHEEIINDMLVYARYSLMETIIVATNISDTTQRFYLDMSKLLPVFQTAYSRNTVVMIKNVISDIGEPDYFFLREFIEQKTPRHLPPFRSLMVSLTICNDDQFIFKKCLTNSIERTKRNLLAHKSIETEQISLLFTDCVENNPTDIARFANVIGSIQHSFLDKLGVNFRELFYNNKKLTDNVEMASRLVAMTGYIIQQSGGQMIPPAKAASAMHDSNKLGPIIFCTPELGRWSTVGGLGVMVDELSIGLADLGQDVYVISPYYERNRKGQTGYLAQDPAGIRYVDNVRVGVGSGFTLGVHEGQVRGVKLAFLHNADIFPSPYPDAQPAYIVQQMAIFGKACLEYCCQRQIIPSTCITNDWFTGLIPAYAKIGQFGDTFKGTQFIHICHNLQESYEGRIFPSPQDGDLRDVHQLPRDFLIDPQWRQIIINPSRCALMLCDQWATVSKSYKEDLLNSSTLSYLLRQKPRPFAFPNGIPIKERIKKLDAAAPDHLSAKKKLQQKYFNFQELDDSVPLFAFVGRVTAQKGVHLICNVAEQLIIKFNYKIQFLVGGPANMREKYSAGCAHTMWHLRNKYPHCFWAAPEEFFTDGAVVNRGADFGLMPSNFEPGGIVQHEFFVGATPVVAFKTGGLKDSVIEFDWNNETGSGFSFEAHTEGDLIFAIERAVGTFRNKPKYLKLRENAFKATMDGEIVSKAWLAEFYRLQDKVFIDYTVVNKLQQEFPLWHPQDYTPISIIQEIFGSEKKNQIYQEIDHGASEDTEGQGYDSPSKLHEIDNIMSAFDEAAFSKRPKQFMLHNRGPRYRKVQLCGSFDEWQIRHDLSFDPFTNQWFTTLHLKVDEEYHYKYIINDDQWVVNDEETQKKDKSGNVNNYCNFTA